MQVHSSVMPPPLTVSGGLVFACQSAVYALDAANGALVRRYDVRGASADGGNTVAGDVVYVALNYMHEHTVQALRVADGTILWRYAAEGRIPGPPLVAGDLVYASIVEGHVVALRTADGGPAWRHESGPILSCSPTVAGDTVYISPAVNQPDQPVVLALDAKAGALHWSAPLPESTSQPLTVARDTVYVATHMGCGALAASDGALRWWQELRPLASRPGTGPLDESAPLVVGDLVCLSYSESGFERSSRRGERSRFKQTAHVVALDHSDGALRWRADLGAGTRAETATALASLGDLIFVGASDGTLHALAASDGALRWRFRTGGELLSAPVATGDAVYVGASDGYVYALRGADGGLLWRAFTSTSVTIASAIQITSISIEKSEDPS